MYVVSQVRRRLAEQRRNDKAGQFKVNSSLDWKPVHWWDVVPTSGSGEKPNDGVLDGLDFPNQAVRHAVQQWITIVQAAGYERLD